MKTTFFGSKLIAAVFISVVTLLQFDCKKDSSQPTTYPIQGLWEGSYTVTGGATHYFSFSVYPNGKLSYKSDAYYGEVEYAAFADGTWTLNGTQFSFSVTTINYPSGSQHQQMGTATYNSGDGTLTDGHISDAVSGDPATWSMTRVK